MAKRTARKTASGAKPPGAPPPKSVMASETVIGWLQFGALLVGAAAFVWSIYSYYVPPSQATAIVEGRTPTIDDTLIEEDFRSLQALHKAIDYVSIYDVSHAFFEEGSRTLVSFMAARSVVLKRYDLLDAFARFSAAFESCRAMPNHETILQLRAAARAFAEPLDDALQRFARAPRTRPGTLSAQRR